MTTKPLALARPLVVEREMPHPAGVRGALTEGSLIEGRLMKNGFGPVVGHRFNLRTTPMRPPRLHPRCAGRWDRPLSLG